MIDFIADEIAYTIATGVIWSEQNYGEVCNENGEHVVDCCELDLFDTDLHYATVCLQDHLYDWVVANYHLLSGKTGDMLRDIGYSIHTVSRFEGDSALLNGLGLPASAIESFPNVLLRPYTNAQFSWAGVRPALLFEIDSVSYPAV